MWQHVKLSNQTRPLDVLCMFLGCESSKNILLLFHLVPQLYKKKKKKKKNRIQRCNSRLFYNLLTAPRTISNMYAQVAWAQWCANHVQHIKHLSHATCRDTCRMIQRDSSATKFDQLKSHLFSLYFTGRTINRRTRGRNRSTQRKPLVTSFRGSPFGVRFLHMRLFFNPTIQAVTFRLRGWCMLGVFLLPAFTRLRHEYQDLLSPCDRMHVCTD